MNFFQEPNHRLSNTFSFTETSRERFRSNMRSIRIVSLFMVFLCGALWGCSPQHYRHKADKEVYSLVHNAAGDASFELHNYTITPDRRSRMFDPFNPDKEPQPLDDPVAHRYMHCVDCTKLRKCKKCLQTRWTENPLWRQYLNLNENGEVLLDKNAVLALALRHSPDYQTALENVYLSALLVSNQRFRFDVQFFGGDSLFYDAQGKLRSSNTSSLTNEADVGFNKLYATGGELTAGLANSITWQFAGPDQVQAGSLFNLNVVQPLLRGAGKKVVLENLTQAERDLLACVRQMVFYQQGFYTNVFTGGGVARPNTGPQGTLNSVVFGRTDGYYGLLAEQVRIQNLEQNVVSLENNLQRLEELFEVWRNTGKLSVVETQSQLYRAQSSLLEQKNGYLRNIETYLRNTLGLPPDTPVRIRDPLLDQFKLISQNLTDLQAETLALLLVLRKKDHPVADDTVGRLAGLMERLRREMRVVDHDYETLLKKVPERTSQLKLFASRFEGSHDAEESRVQKVDPRIYDENVFRQEIANVKKRIDEQQRNFEALQVLIEYMQTFDRAELLRKADKKEVSEDVLAAVSVLHLTGLLDAKENSRDYDGLLEEMQGERARSTSTPETTENPAESGEPTDREGDKLQTGSDDSSPEEVAIKERARRPEEIFFRNWVNRIADTLSAQEMEVSLCQVITRLQAITLVPTDISAEESFEIASANRFDWMNARSSLVDQWRKIDVAANALKGYLSVRVEAEGGTIDQDGLKFDAKNSSVRTGLVWDSPLTRHEQQSAYRKSLIDYQQARRDYYAYVDSINANLRDTIRLLEKNQIDFEISRANILVSATRVDMAQMELIRPASAAGASGKDSNIAQRVIDALQGLLSAQNEFLNLWVQYESLRMGLDLQMGTMKLDEHGAWVDPGPLTSQSLRDSGFFQGRSGVHAQSVHAQGVHAQGVHAQGVHAQSPRSISPPIPPAIPLGTVASHGVRSLSKDDEEKLRADTQEMMDTLLAPDPFKQEPQPVRQEALPAPEPTPAESAQVKSTFPEPNEPTRFVSATFVPEKPEEQLFPRFQKDISPQSSRTRYRKTSSFQPALEQSASPAETPASSGETSAMKEEAPETSQPVQTAGGRSIFGGSRPLLSRENSAADTTPLNWKSRPPLTARDAPPPPEE